MEYNATVEKNKEYLNINMVLWNSFQNISLSKKKQGIEQYI